MHRLPLSSLHIFLVTAESDSFSQAATKLCITPSAVSKQIKQLENYLKTPLFYRGILRHTQIVGLQPPKLQHIVLTESGVLLQQHFKSAFQMIHQGISRVTKNETIYLRIMSAPTFATRWLARNLQDFHYQYPFVETTILDTSSHQRTDCEIIYSKSKPTDDAVLLMLEKNSAICAAHLFESDIERIFMGRQLLHILLNNEKKLSLWEDWLSLANISKMRLPINLDKGLSFSTQDQAINATLSGLGIAVLDQNMITDLLRTRWLFTITNDALIGPFGYWLTLKNNSNNPALELFKDWILERIINDTYLTDAEKQILH